MISEDCFFIVVGSSLVCWDFQRHKQYELSTAHVRRLVFVMANEACVDQDNPLDKDLIRAGIVKVGRGEPVVWGWDILSRIYHFGTKNIPLVDSPEDEEAWAKSYLAHCEEVWQKEVPVETAARFHSEGIILPRSLRDGPIEHVLRARSTTREFLDVPVDLEALAHILQYTLGFVAARQLPESSGLPEAFRKRRCSPSGGGLNSTEGYVMVKNVEGLESGMYYYDPYHHQLILLSSEIPPLGKLLSGQHFADAVPVGVFFTSRFDKLWWKYEHSRAYRNALLEVGHVAQTFQIMSTSLGLGTWLTGALCEKDVEPLLKLESNHEQVLFFVGCGHASGATTPESLRALAK